MFARSAFKSFLAAAPLRQTSAGRRYATGPSGSGGANPLVIAAAVAALAGGGYYLYTSSGSAAAKAPSAAAAAAPDAAAASGKAKATFTGGDQGFVSLELESVETLNHNTKQFRFKLPEADSVSGMRAASALLTKFKPEGEGQKPVIRPYTAVSDDDAEGYLDLLIKKYEGGPMSTHIHSLVPGQKLDVKGPIVKYAWTPDKHEHIALVAGGTGITPMYQLLRAIFKKPGADKTKVTLVFGNIAEEDILLRKQLNELENTYPQQFRAFYVLEKPPTEKWTGGTTGYITKDLLKEVLPEPKSGNIKVFVCGPPGMMKALSGPKKSPTDQGELTGALKELGYTQEQVLKF